MLMFSKDDNTVTVGKASGLSTKQLSICTPARTSPFLSLRALT